MAKTKQKKISTSRSNKTKVSPYIPTKSRATEGELFFFQKKNLYISLIGVFLLVLGFILLSGGESNDPNVFSYEIFNERRLIVAPILIIAGFVVQIVAIMYNPTKE